MNFVDTTNTSIHSMIEIINNQQRSFNQIIKSIYSTPIPQDHIFILHVFNRDISDRYLFSNNQFKYLQK